MDLVLSAPSVLYRHLSDGTEVKVDNPSYWPSPGDISHIEEPYIRAYPHPGALLAPS